MSGSASNVCGCCGQALPSAIDRVALTAGLSRMQRKLFLAVAAGKGEPIAYERLIDNLYADRLDGGPLLAKEIIKVMRTNSNHKLRAHGFQIQSLFGFGFYLEVIQNSDVEAA